MHGHDSDAQLPPTASASSKEVRASASSLGAQRAQTVQTRGSRGGPHTACRALASSISERARRTLVHSHVFPSHGCSHRAEGQGPPLTRAHAHAHAPGRAPTPAPRGRGSRSPAPTPEAGHCRRAPPRTAPSVPHGPRRLPLLLQAGSRAPPGQPATAPRPACRPPPRPPEAAALVQTGRSAAAVRLVGRARQAQWPWGPAPQPDNPPAAASTAAAVRAARPAAASAAPGRHQRRRRPPPASHSPRPSASSACAPAALQPAPSRDNAAWSAARGA